MSFLTGQDRTPKFAGQVLPDRTKSGLTFLNILLHKNTRKNYEKKNLKKKLKILKKNFGFISILKGLESGKEKTGSPESGHFKICRASWPNVMSGWALDRSPCVLPTVYNNPIYTSILHDLDGQMFSKTCSDSLMLAWLALTCSKKQGDEKTVKKFQYT